MSPTAWPSLGVMAVAACGRFGFGDHIVDDASPPPDCAAPSDLAAGLVGWWKLDEPSGTVAFDSAGTSDGLLAGGTSRVAGHLGGAVAFDGLTGRIDIGGDVSYATHAAPFSFSAWVNLADFSMGEPDVMQIQTDNASSPFHVLLSNDPAWDGMSTGDGDGSWIPLRTDMQPSTGTWHHVAVVYNGLGATTLANFQFFLDAVVQPLAQASPYGTQANQSRIGASNNQGNFWTGIIDDVRIYNRALSSVEVGELLALTCE